MDYKPRDYQKYAEDFILDHEEAGLFLDMGLGKTAATLSAISKLDWDIERVLVIAPKEPAVHTWPEELEKWDQFKDLDWSLAVGTQRERVAALNKRSFITIINRENVAWLVKRYLKLHWPWDCVVIDELSSFKNPSAKRFKALRKVRPYIKRIIGLTGTPASNGYMDLWAECFLLDQGKALGRTITGYRQQYFTPGWGNGAVVYRWDLRSGAEEEIQKKISPMCISMKTEDYLELPDRLDIVKRFPLSSKSQKQYLDMEKNYLLEIDGETVDAVNAAVVSGKLMQICSGAIYDEDHEAIILHDEKIEVIKQLIEEAQEENVIIFYGFRHEKSRLMKAFPEAVDLKSPGAYEKWKAGEIKILLAHPASAGHGLNLQTGGHISIWFTLPTSLELYQQAIKRLHRQGQTDVVRNYIVLTEGTYEEDVYYRILMSKEEKQNAILEAVKARLEGRI